MMHLVYYGIIDAFQCGSAVIGPAFRVGVGKVYYGGTVAVGPYGLGPHSGSFVKPFALVFYLESVEFAV